MIVAESGFTEANAHTMPHIPPVARANAFPGFVDRHFVLPRFAALPVMAGLARSYETCRGSLAAPTLEQWLHKVLEETATAKGIPYRHYGFPFVLVRKDVNQPSVSCDFQAWLNISCNTLYPPERSLGPRSLRGAHGLSSRAKAFALRDAKASALHVVRAGQARLGSTSS